jgi:hypothetical protein
MRSFLLANALLPVQTQLQDAVQDAVVFPNAILSPDPLIAILCSA